MPAAAHDPHPRPSQLPWQREGELGIPVTPGEHSWESSFPEWAQGCRAEALSLAVVERVSALSKLHGMKSFVTRKGKAGWGGDE